MFRKPCHDPKNEELFARWKRCVETHSAVLREKHSTAQESFDEISETMFVCMPRYETMEEAFGNHYMIDEEKSFRKKFRGQTLFKIPVHVNDIEGYVRMLLRKQL